MVEKKVSVQDGVTIEVDKLRVKIKGPKGELEKDFDNPVFNSVITMEKNNEIIVKSNADNRKVAAMIGTICSHIKNMSLGVTVGFRYKMKIFYSHFPMAVSVKDGIVEIKNSQLMIQSHDTNKLRKFDYNLTYLNKKNIFGII